MTYEVYGIPANSDLAVFETDLPSTVNTETLASIMGWESEEDAFLDYRLTPEQISDIEHLATIELPKELALYLSCHA
ncbi:hypothetical protein D3879_03695 [Pseudomonas cavernicola]|uniref:DUF7683 domain-containing protein n=1 Tax=Pseudomonas cavernicola TaxID=2320866 RepID=A0A418XIX7_9PSED|nr:hypothetical protein [Pseudomonas cavernicola]RJG12407.1 hypothetical protein D3879_03695 [Pseudomonas cavernicola]